MPVPLFSSVQRVKYVVLRLRRKITAVIEGRLRISTVRGVGYRYHPPR